MILNFDSGVDQWYFRLEDICAFDLFGDEARVLVRGAWILVALPVAKELLAVWSEGQEVRRVVLPRSSLTPHRS